jgi:hypothetical protein
VHSSTLEHVSHRSQQAVASRSACSDALWSTRYKELYNVKNEIFPKRVEEEERAHAVPVKFNVLVTQRLLLILIQVIKGAAIASTAGLGRCLGAYCSHRALSITGLSCCAPAAGRFANLPDQLCSNTSSY